MCEINTCVESVSGLMFPWRSSFCWTQHSLHPSTFKSLPMMLCSLFRENPPSSLPTVRLRLDPRSWWSGPTRSRVWFLVWGAWWSPPRPGPSRSWAGPDRPCMWPRLPPQERTLLQYCQRETDEWFTRTHDSRKTSKTLRFEIWSYCIWQHFTVILHQPTNMTIYLQWTAQLFQINIRLGM